MMGRIRLTGKVQALPLLMILAAVGLGAWGIINRYFGPAGHASGAGLNLLLITLDTTLADRLGCYGYAKAHTPHLDRLAREGVMFDQCISSVPITLPSHASIMTGTYPFIHGARDNGSYRVADENETLAERLKQAGYVTGALIASPVLNGQYNLTQGFDLYVDLPEPVYEGPILPPAADQPPPTTERKANEMADRAIAWLRDHASRRFFLWVHFYDPHWPYEPPAEFAERCGGDVYDGEVSFMDAQIGRILDELKALKLQETTLVALLADHGEGLGEHGEDTHGFFLYDTTLRVPFILRSPGRIPPGRLVAEQVRTIDVAPTILASLQLPSMPAAEGVNLMPLVLGESDQWQLEAYGETWMPYHGFFYSWLRCLRAAGWKFVLAPRCELFQVAEDPRETRNLIDVQPDQAAAMRTSLKELIENATPVLSMSGSRANLSAGAAQQLGAIGYAVAPADQESFESGIAGFEPRFTDPKDRLEVIRLWEEGVAALWNRDLQRGETIFRELREREPTVAPLRGKLAQVLAMRGSLEEAIRTYQEALQLDPKLAPVHTDLGFLFRQAGRLAEAIHHFQAVVDLMPDDPFALYNLANTLSLAGRGDEATSYLRRADEMTEGTSPQIQYNLGTVLAESGQPQEAIQHFRSAVELKPDYAEAHYNLANVLVRAERIDDALPHYRQALKIKPDFSAAAVNLGTVLARTGRKDQAIECLYQVMRSDPGYRETYGRLFRLLDDAGRDKEALEVLDTGLEHHPEDTSLAISLAWVLAASPDPQLRDGSRAVQLAESVCRRIGDADAQALHILAAAYAEAGRFDEAAAAARKALERATATGPNHLIESIKKLLDLCEQGKPYRQP